MRFAASLGFALDDATRAAIKAQAPRITQISVERIFTELSKMLVCRHAGRAFELLRELGLLAPILPEVERLAGVPQPVRYHPEGDVWTHTRLMLEQMVHPSAELAWAALLHDVGKPPTFERGPDGIEHFPCHAQVGGELTRKILKRLHCATRFRDRVAAAVHGHMGFADVREMKQSTLRRLLARETFPMELELHRLDCLASHRRLENYVFALDKLAEFKNEPVVPPPLVTGRDVLATGLAPGPEVGRVLRSIQELQLNGELSTRAAALAWLERYSAKESQS